MTTARSEKKERAIRKVWYHGSIGGVCTFSYTCGKCGMNVDGADICCKGCGAYFVDIEED